MLYGNNSPVRQADNPLAWVGDDRLLLNDRTAYGLRRKVYANKGDVPNQVLHLAKAYQEAGEATVHWWMFEDDGFHYLWIVWKVSV